MHKVTAEQAPQANTEWKSKTTSAHSKSNRTKPGTQSISPPYAHYSCMYVEACNPLGVLCDQVKGEAVARLAEFFFSLNSAAVRLPAAFFLFVRLLSGDIFAISLSRIVLLSTIPLRLHPGKTADCKPRLDDQATFLEKFSTGFRSLANTSSMVSLRLRPALSGPEKRKNLVYGGTKVENMRNRKARTPS